MEWRRRGLELLFEFYAEYKRTSPIKLCKQFHIQIGPSYLFGIRSLGFLGGNLLLPTPRDAQWKIALGDPYYETEWLSSFVIGHELGHYCLLSQDVEAYYPNDDMEEGLNEEMEYWCDGFSTAFLFAAHGIEILSAENYTTFLMERGILIENEADVFQGKRILRLCEDVFTDPPDELLLLGDVLVRSEEIQKKLNKRYER